MVTEIKNESKLYWISCPITIKDTEWRTER